MTPISFEDIRELAGKDETIDKSLSFGFLRGCTEEQLVDLLMRHLYEKPTFSWAFRCYLEHSEKTLADQVVSRLLSELQRQPEHHKCQTLAYCLDRLSEQCSGETRAQIIRMFLCSGKRYLRKYAYAKNLSAMPPDLLEMTYARLNEFPEEAPFFLRTAADNYPDVFIEANFSRLIAFEHIHRRELSKLFIRKAELSPDEWKWLEEHYPDSVLYIAAKRGHLLTDDECVRFTAGSLTRVTNYSWGDIKGPDGLKLWCLAKIGKWTVIRNLLATAHPTAVQT